MLARARLPQLSRRNGVGPRSRTQHWHMKKRHFADAHPQNPPPTKNRPQIEEKFSSRRAFIDTRRVVHFKVDAMQVPDMLEMQRYEKQQEPQKLPFAEVQQKETQMLGKMKDMFGDKTPSNLIGAYNDTCFLIGDKLIEGPIVMFTDAYFSWNVKKVEDITPDSLSIFQLRYPKPQLLILGVGPSIVWRQDLFNHLQSLQIAYELLDTPGAVAAWNFCLQEGREVAAALLPFRLPE